MKKLTESCKNITWEVNQAIIQDAYIKLIMSLKRCPTLKQVSDEVKLSITTLKKHVDRLEFKPLKNPLRSLTPDVLVSIYNSALKGSSASQKLWMQIMEGWAERQELTGKDGEDLMPDYSALSIKEKVQLHELLSKSSLNGQATRS